MTAVLVVETVVLALLCVLVAGLLRGYAGVLQRLHALDGGAADQPPPFRTVADVVEPAARPTVGISGRDEWQPAHDVEGVTLTGEIVSARTVGVPRDTVLAFLSSGCDGCAGFWHELAEGLDVALPAGSRLLVVTKAPTDESPAALAALCPAGVDLVMSSQAWSDYAVPGSPYIVVADGRTGRVKGEGSGTSFSQIGGLISQASADGSRISKPAADRERESDVDRALLAAGIGPGDPSLYGVAEPGTDAPSDSVDRSEASGPAERPAGSSGRTDLDSPVRR
jgi:hypothetical protein